jgi:hypothetical protein
MPQSMQRAACLRRSRSSSGSGELAKVPHAVAGELILLLLPVVFEEARDLAHRMPAFVPSAVLVQSPGPA